MTYEEMESVVAALERDAALAAEDAGAFRRAVGCKPWEDPKDMVRKCRQRLAKLGTIRDALEATGPKMLAAHARLQAIGGKIEAVAARDRPDNQEDLEKFAGLSLEFDRAREELQRCVAESQRLGALCARLAATYRKLEEVLVLWLDAFLAEDDEDGDD
jgi:hypothetical protein